MIGRLRSAQKYLFSSLFKPFSERKLKQGSEEWGQKTDGGRNEKNCICLTIYLLGQLIRGSIAGSLVCEGNL